MSSPKLCPKCKSEVHVDASICPFCKSKLKMGWFKKLMLVFFGLMIFSFVTSYNKFQDKRAARIANPIPEKPKAPDYRDKVKFDYTWVKGGFGSIAKINIKIRNDSDIYLKDIPARCEFYSESKTRLDRKEFVIFKNFPSKKTVSVSELNVGFIPEFTKSMYCELMLEPKF